MNVENFAEYYEIYDFSAFFFEFEKILYSSTLLLLKKNTTYKKLTKKSCVIDEFSLEANEMTLQYKRRSMAYACQYQ